MDRVLALQGLSQSADFNSLEAGCSGESIGCSSSSSGEGKSSCSNSCGGSEELDW